MYESTRLMYMVTDDITLGLLECDKTIASETAAIFYGRNHSCFCNDHQWFRVAEWLERIGRRTRSLIRQLTVSVGRPLSVWQHTDGTRSCMTLTQHHKVNIRRETDRQERASLQDFFALPPAGIREGVGEKINPALETVFQWISDREPECPKVVLRLDRNEAWGILTWTREMDLEVWLEQFGVDMPNVIESLRAKHAAKSGNYSVEVP